MKYKISLEKTDEGYAIRCPGLPDCSFQGQTKKEALTIGERILVKDSGLTVEEFMNLL